MGSFDCAPAPQRTPNISHHDGDQGSFSKDASTFREGSVSNVTSGPLFTLLGGTQAMKYWAHNCAIDANGNFLAKDDPGSSGLLVYDENDQWQFFGAPAAARGTKPVFTKHANYDFQTGAWAMYNLTIGGLAAITVPSTSPAGTMFFDGAGKQTSTGVQNVGIGASALSAITTGVQNVGIGQFALSAITTGNYNTALGAGALSSVSGSDSTNTAIGSSAGSSYTYNNSTFIGYNADSTAGGSGGTNITAIGNGVRATKSNQVVIGNTSVVETLLNGNVGIGLIGPTAVLHLNAGSATAGTSPLKLNSGTLLTTAEAGAIEFLTDSFYATATTGAKRRMLVAANSGRSVGAVAAVSSVLAYTLPAVDGSFEVSANVLVTTATTHSFTVTVSYTDEGNTVRSLTLNFCTLAGVISNAAITNVAGAVPYEGVPMHIRCKASTTITIATVGTFTAVAYNVEGSIRQIA